MKKIILNNFKEQAYIECVKDKGYYSDLEVIFNIEQLKDSDESCLLIINLKLIMLLH